MRIATLLALVLSASVAYAQKESLDESIRERADDSWEMAQRIWEWAEPGYQEEKSSKLLADRFERAGFTVKRGVAGVPTAFTAEFGSGKPVIGLLGEFDALPGLSQEPVPHQQARAGTTWGHACGHHLFGVASLSAAIALAEQIEAGNLAGTVRYYGCPAEEGGGGKVFMVREGLFEDCDAVLHWHPSDSNAAGDRSSLARIAAKFRFHGTSAHAALSPELGRSALDAVALTNHGAELLREHTPDFTRIHHVISAGGTAPNVVPNFSEVYYYVRHPDATVVRGIYDRLLKCAQAGALATETELEVDFLGGYVEILANKTLSAVALENFEAMADLSYDAEEIAFAKQLQKTMPLHKSLKSIEKVKDVSGETGMASTDVGDVSWVVPTTGIRVACWVPGVSAHSWQAVASGNTSIGRKGMQLAARVLAATAWDIYGDPELLESARGELEQRLASRQYAPLFQPGQEPPLDYRDPPSAKPRK